MFVPKLFQFLQCKPQLRTSSMIAILMSKLPLMKALLLLCHSASNWNKNKKKCLNKNTLKCTMLADTGIHQPRTQAL